MSRRRRSRRPLQNHEPEPEEKEPPMVFKIIGGLVVSGMIIAVAWYLLWGMGSTSSCHYDSFTNMSIVTEGGVSWKGDVSGESHTYMGNVCDDN